jgi:hypothetical protein
MADLAQLEAALVKADAAGDADGARILAGEVRKMRSAAPVASPAELSSTLPANAGLAKLATSVLGLPVDTIENVANLGLAGVGTALTAAGKPDLAPNLLKGSFGGSDSLQRGLRATGMPGLSPDNPRPQDALGTAQYDFVARGGPLPGGAIPAAASMAAEAIGGPEWAGVGSLAPSAATAGYNAARAKSLIDARARNVVRDATLKDAQDAGYKVIPSQVNPGLVENAAESLAGKAALKQRVTIENQGVTDAIARREIGLPENAPLTMQTLEARRQALSAPYKALEAVSSNAAYFLRELRDARQKATQFWKEYERQATVASLENFKAMNAKATAMEGRLDAEAVRVGKPDLVPQMRAARQDIAKTWDVERALNLGDGTIDAQVLGRLHDHGAKLSGGLETIAKFAQGPGKQVTGQAAAQGTPGVSKLNWTVGTLLGAGGLAAFGPVAGAVGAAAPFVAPPMARGALLSDIYQRNFARPNYEPAMQPENNLQSLARIAIMANQNAR